MHLRHGSPTGPNWNGPSAAWKLIIPGCANFYTHQSVYCTVNISHTACVDAHIKPIRFLMGTIWVVHMGAVTFLYCIVTI